MSGHQEVEMNRDQALRLALAAATRAIGETGRKHRRALDEARTWAEIATVHNEVLTTGRSDAP